MPVILQVDFPFPGPFGAEMAAQLKGLAESIAQEPGFIWKVWTESAERKEAGGIYLFEDRSSAEAYLEMHSKRLKGFGVPEVHAKIFEVNEELTGIDFGPLKRA
ncbi:mono-oxygenase [Hyaloraphidium curvatum]|nr:mono-oxygenase [Hyaloraphidium curvatum]